MNTEEHKKNNRMTPATAVALSIVLLPICISIGLAIGCAVGSAHGNILRGISYGLMIGSVVGALLSTLANVFLKQFVTAVIFDFNGTMIFDEALQEEAWRATIKEEFGHDIADEEFTENVHGRNTEDIVAYFAGVELDKAESKRISQKKIDKYQELCLQSPDFVLAPGLEEFLDKLKEEGVLMTIATASSRPNLEFYFKELHLDRWFDIDKVAYNDGKVAGKPAPDIFLNAAHNIDVGPQNCVVFEDSLNGIEAAKAAGVKDIVKVAAVFHGNADDDILEISDYTDPNMLYSMVGVEL